MQIGLLVHCFTGIRLMNFSTSCSLTRKLLCSSWVLGVGQGVATWTREIDCQCTGDD